MNFTATQHSLMGLHLIASRAGANFAGYDMHDCVRECKINAVGSQRKTQNNALDARKSSPFQIFTKATNGSTVSMFTVKSVF